MLGFISFVSRCLLSTRSELEAMGAILSYNPWEYIEAKATVLSYQSGCWQAIDGNWGEFNEGTTYRVLAGVREPSRDGEAPWG